MNSRLAYLNALFQRKHFSKDELINYHKLQYMHQFEQSLLKIVNAFPKYEAIWSFQYNDAYNDYYVNCVLIHSNQIYLLRIVTEDDLPDLNLLMMQMHHLAELFSYIVGKTFNTQPILIAENINHPQIITFQNLTQWLHHEKSQTIHEVSESTIQQLTVQKINLKKQIHCLNYQTHYDLKQIKLGARCPHCQSVDTMQKMVQLIYCNSCKQITHVQPVFLNLVEEFQMLYPHKKITSAHLHEFSNGLFSRRQLLSLLNQYLVKQGNKKGAHYLYPLENLSV